IRTDEVRWDSGPHLPDRIHRRSRIRDLGRARTGRGAVGRRPGEGPGTRHHTRGDARTRHRSDRSGAHSGGGRVYALAESNHRRANVFAVGAQPGLDHRGGKGPFIGRKALLEEQRRGPSRRTVGLEIDWQTVERFYWDMGLPPQPPAEPWREKVPLYSGYRQIGWATSGCW